MARVLIVTDPLESGRQIHADGGDFIRRLAESTLIGRRGITVEVVSGAMVDRALATLDPRDVSAVVFASNSLRHPDSAVVAAASSRSGAIADYLNAGGGVLVLHQFVVGQVLDAGLTKIVFGPRREGHTFPLRPTSDHRSVLEIPNPITADSRPPTDPGTQLGDRGYWCAIDESELVNCEIVLRSANGDALVATSIDGSPGRIAVCTIPIDWHGWQGLGANLIRYTALGTPDVIVWGDEETAYSDPASHLALSSGGAVAWSFNQKSRLSRLDPAPRLHIVLSNRKSGSEDQDQSTTPDQVSVLWDGLARGATVLDLDSHPLPGIVKYSVWVGHSGYLVGSRAIQELRGSNFLQDWSTDPYPLRNSVIAAEYFASRHPTIPGTWQPSSDDKFARWLKRFPVYPGMTVTSALAVAQAVHLIDRRHPRLDELMEIVSRTGGSPADPSSEILRRTRDERPRSIDSWLRAILSDHRLTDVEACRILDWIGYLNFIDVECHDAELAGLVATRLADLVTTPTKLDGLSIESVANAALGLAALVDYGARGAHEALNRVTPVLRSWLDTVEPMTQTSIYLRVAHALARSEDVSPLGVDVMSDCLTLLRGRDGVPDDRQDTRTSSLADSNRRLLDRVTALERRTRTMISGYLLGSAVAVLLIVGLPASVVIGALRELPRLDLNELLVPAFVVAASLFAGLVILANRIGLIPEQLRWMVGWAGSLWKRYVPVAGSRDQAGGDRRTH